MSNTIQQKMPEIFEHQLKDEQGQVIETRKYYTAKGLAARLPGTRKGHMHISTVYELFRQGMPGITRIAGTWLLPVYKLPQVMDWLEERRQRI